MSMVMMRVAGVPPESGIAVGAEESVADVFEGVVHPLPVMPGIGLFDQPPVRALDQVDPWLGQGSEHRLQFGAEGTGEPQGAGPGSVSAAVELDVAAVVVELVFGSGAVGVDPVDHLGGEHAQLGDGVDVGEPDQQLFPFVDVSRVEAAPVDLRQRPFDDRHLLRATRPACCAAARCGRNGARGWPSMLVRSPTAAAARTRRDASPGDSRSTLINTRIIDGCVNASGRFRVSASPIKAWSISGIRFRVCSRFCITPINRS